MVVQMEYWGRRDGRRPLESPILRSDSTLGDLSEVFFGAIKRKWSWALLLRSCPASCVTNTSPYGKVLEWSRRTQWCGSLSQVTDDTWRSAFSSLCPLGSRGPLRPVLRTQLTLRSLLPRACIPVAISRSDFGADRELTRRIDSSPASVCAPTASVGRCALGFRLERRLFSCRS